VAVVVLLVVVPGPPGVTVDGEHEAGQVLSAEQSTHFNSVLDNFYP